MPIPEFKRVETIEANIKLMQDFLEPLLFEFTRRPQNDSELIENIELTTGIRNDVVHRLNRQPRGWYIARKNAFCDIAEITATTSNEVLSLLTTADVTISMVVF